ncbi:MAG: hypothetical protein EA350_13260 [Gemmatimonadales bacterium]|nr:MAG: hypothetical protein EA350_13260 [Gemmatimonadales bacterium]
MTPPLGKVVHMLAAAWIGAGACFAAAGAQITPPRPGELERQEVLLPEAGVLEITPELRVRLGLFPEITGFRSARLFVGEAGDRIVELEWAEDGRIVRQRRPLSPADLDAMRGWLLASVADAGTLTALDREGRGSLVLGHTVLGLVYHGWAVPVALDVSSGQGAVAAYLLTAGTSFYLPYRLTRDRAVTPAHTGLSLYGGSRGIVAGILAGDMLAGAERNGDSAGRFRLGGGVVGGALGGTLGFLAVDRWEPRQGDSELWGAFGDAGMLAGAAVGYLAGPYKSEPLPPFGDPDYRGASERSRNARAGHALTLGGHGAGLALGAWLSGRRDYETGDVSTLRSATVLGVQTGATLVRIAGDDPGGDAWVGGMLVGGILGTVAGDRWLGPRGLTTGAGLLVNAGHLAGAATGAGITYLIVDDIGDSEFLLLAASTLGGMAGTALVWNAVNDGAPQREGRAGRAAGPGPPGAGLRSGIPAPGPSMGGWRNAAVQVHPASILRGMVPGLATPGAAGGEARHTAPASWVTIRF